MISIENKIGCLLQEVVKFRCYKHFLVHGELGLRDTPMEDLTVCSGLVQCHLSTVKSLIGTALKSTVLSVISVTDSIFPGLKFSSKFVTPKRKKR